MDQKWYEGFFQGIVVEMWQKAATPRQTRLEVDFLCRALQLRRGDRVLDVPCGFGRHSVELASRGFCISGVDGSAQMLAEAQRRSVDAGLAIEWRNVDMRDLSWEGEFDAAFCMGNSFGYFGPGETRKFLLAVSRSLKPGARLALDYGMAAECVLPNLRRREWACVEDILFLEENLYHAAESCIETTYTFVRKGAVHRQKGLHWVYTAREACQFLQEAGFQALRIYGSLDEAPFEVGSPCLVLVGQKGSETCVEQRE